MTTNTKWVWILIGATGALVVECIFIALYAFILGFPSSPAPDMATVVSQAVQSTQQAVLRVRAATPQPTDTPTPSPNPEPTATAIPSYTVGADVRVGNMQWKVLKAKNMGNVLKATDSNNTGLEKDQRSVGYFVYVEVEAENVGSEPLSIGHLDLYDGKSRKFIPSTDVNAWIPEDLQIFLLDYLNPNVPVHFAEIYQVPKDANRFKLMVSNADPFDTQYVPIDLGF